MDTIREVRSIALSTYEANDTALSLSCWILLSAGGDDEIRQLVKKKADPRQYLDSNLHVVRKHGWPDGDRYFRDNASTALLKKFPFECGIDRAEAAWQSFRTAEQRCCLTNTLMDRLRRTVDDNEDFFGLSKYVPFVKKVRKFISRVLGPLPDQVEPGFGPGSTYGDRGDSVTVAHKISSIPTCTARAWPLVSSLWGDRYRTVFEKHSTTCLPDFVRGNRYLTVPKTATTDRAISVEPSLLVYFQKGLGRHIRLRLKRFGIDLDHGQGIHQRLLEQQAADFSTIDLQSASDTVARELVRLLLPEDWYEVMDQLRSHETRLPGKGERWYRNHKFSSMGNGFTFELETLVFFALLSGLSEELRGGENLFVYGDDIIVPSGYANAALGVLDFFGFVPNADKTFVSGPFKESCGFDVFDERPVRAYYIKDVPREPADFFSIANGLRHLDRRYSGDLGVDILYRNPWHRALDCVPNSLRRLRGPAWLGDQVIFDESAQPTVVHGVSHYRTLVPYGRKVRLAEFHPEVGYAAVLYGAFTSTTADAFIGLRGDPIGYRVKWNPPMPNVRSGNS